ncbi:hypothetical protein BDR07DRAFT_1377391 [Suillus spraguei]|nr:hypothetical protein BDR07DRAFT_1377391 [Suillus spraguei]
MTDVNQLGDPRSVPPPDIETYNETNAAERLGRPRSRIFRFLGNVTNGVIKKISGKADIVYKCPNLRGSRSRRDPVLPNVDREGTSSIPNIEHFRAPKMAWKA